MTADILDQEILERSGIVPSPGLMIRGLETDERSADSIAYYIAYVHVADVSSPVEIRFEINAAVAVADDDVPGNHILNACGHLAAYAESVAFRIEATVAHQYVPGGDSDSPAVLVAPRLYCDGVVATVEGAVFYQYIRSVFGIATIVIEIVTGNLHSPHCDIVAEHRMDHPVGAVQDGNAFYQYILAAEGLDHTGRQDRLVAKTTFFHRDAVKTHLAKAVLLRGALRTEACETAGSTAVQHSLSGYRDILLAIGIHEWGIIIQLRPLEYRTHGRKVIGNIGTEQEFRPFFKMKIHIALEDDRALAFVTSFTDNHTAATFGAAALYGRIQRKDEFSAGGHFIGDIPKRGFPYPRQNFRLKRTGAAGNSKQACQTKHKSVPHHFFRRMRY